MSKEKVMKCIEEFITKSDLQCDEPKVFEYLNRMSAYAVFIFSKDILKAYWDID